MSGVWNITGARGVRALKEDNGPQGRPGKSCTRHTRCVRTFSLELRTFWFTNPAHLSGLQISLVIEVIIEE